MGTGLNNSIRTGQVGAIPCWMNKWLNRSSFFRAFYSLKMEDLTSFSFGECMQQLLSNRSSGGMWNLLIPRKRQLWNMRPFHLPAPPEQLHEGLLPAIYFSGATMVSSEPCRSFKKVQERPIFCFWYWLGADLHHWHTSSAADYTALSCRHNLNTVCCFYAMGRVCIKWTSAPHIRFSLSTSPTNMLKGWGTFIHQT